MNEKNAMNAMQMMTVLTPTLTCILERLRISTIGIARVITSRDIAPPVRDTAVASPPVSPYRVRKNTWLGNDAER